MANLIWNKFFILFTFIFFVNCETENYVVTLKNGKIAGHKKDSYYAFEGIRYAAPPINENRFEPPKPYTEKWDDIKNVTKPGNPCMQWDHFIFTDDKLRGSEDCLFLNVFTPNIKPEKKYPVVFYIHGGALMFSSGDYFGEQYLMHRPIVYVNFNYRLGPLGFISTQDDVVPGNMGLKDQNYALKWVKENIEKFGGDPEKITIVGYSAGAASVHLHYLSKLSNGLFHNGISHSGCALNPWIMQENALEKAKILGSHLGCTTCCTKKLIKCLKEKSAEDIVRSVKLFQVWLYNPFSPFGAVVENEHENAFLTDSPLALIESGKIYNVPWLASATESEGIYPAGEIMQKDEYLIQLNNKWNDIAPFLLDYNFTIPYEQHNDAAMKIRKYYINDKEIDKSTFSSIIKMLSDRLFIYGLQQSIKKQSKQSKSPIYFYYFKFSSTIGLEHILSDHNYVDDLGVSHGDDVYLIYDVKFRQPYPFNEDEIVIQNKLLDLYYNYSEYGRLAFGDVELETVNSQSNSEGDDDKEFTYLEIIGPDNAVIKQTKDLCNEEFWNQYPPN